MSAIVGVFYLDGRPAGDDAASAMLSVLGHRGTGMAAAWSDGSVAFGHRAGWVDGGRPAAAGIAVDRVTGRAVVADARLDDREHLLAALGDATPDPRRAPSAAELLLAAYARWGDDCPRRLLGDFAFAVWDPREHSLFCARDPMGVRPFYYFRSDRVFAFASEIRALLTLPEVPKRVNALRVACHIDAIFEDRELTFYDGILRLPAASRFRVGTRPGGPDRYWEPDGVGDVRYRAPREYVDAWRELFHAAVRDRIEGEAAIGAALSGGLDSSSIALVAARHLACAGSGPLHTFSAVFPSLPRTELERIDERPFIGAAERASPAAAHHVRVDQASPLGDLDRVLWHQEEPSAGPNLYLHWTVYGAAREHGMRVFLEGMDGDTTVSHGYGRLDELAWAAAWPSFAAEVRALERRMGAPARFLARRHALPALEQLARTGHFGAWIHGAGELSREFRLSTRSMLLRQGLRPLLPDAAVRGWRARRRDPWRSASPLAPELARRVDLAGYVERVRTAPSPLPPTEREAHRRALLLPLYQLALEVQDRTAAAFELEPRYPFLDRRLIEFCLALPPQLKLADGWTRLVLREAMDGILPPEIQWRTGKADLSPNFHRGLAGPDRALLERIVSGRSGRLDEFVDRDALRRVFERYVSGSSPAPVREDDGLLLFRTAMLSHWLDTAAPPH